MVSARIIRAQIAYAAAAASRSTARAIVVAKLRNDRLLLADYRRERDRAQSPLAAVLRTTQHRLLAGEQAAADAADRSDLFRREAQAARAFWQAIGVLCHRGDHWRRTYPHATDSLNLLLNTGYTALARRALAAVVSAKLLPQFGVLHAESAGRGALAYDLMEGFRAVAVDAVIIPLFSRQKKFGRELNDREFSRGCARLAVRWQYRFFYRGRCERLEEILRREAVRLRQAILADMPWEPYHHPFGHHRRCR